jgi:hypothetical protein
LTDYLEPNGLPASFLVAAAVIQVNNLRMDPIVAPRSE